jgi:hypothetical protein
MFRVAEDEMYKGCTGKMNAEEDNGWVRRRRMDRGCRWDEERKVHGAIEKERMQSVI